MGRAALVVTSLLLVSAASAFAADPAPKRVEMTTYQFVMLKDAPFPAAEPEPARLDALRKEHVARLEVLADRGLAIAAGPVEGGGDLRGVVVLAVASRPEAIALMADDPLVRAGLMIADVRPWFAAKNVFRPRSGAFTDLAPCFLGFLWRPADAPRLDPKAADELQEGHMANIRAMAASGDLVIAGPMGEDTTLRGLFVFRTASADRVRELVSRDPAIRAHRLAMQLVTWQLPRGVIPPAS